MLGVGVQHRHPDLAAIASIHCSRAIDDRDAMFRGKATAWHDEADIPIRKSDRDSCADGRATTGSKLEADLKLIFFKSLSILGSTMGSRGELLHIVDLVGKGLLRPVVDRVLPLSEIRAAHEAMGRREQFGKIVLSVGDGK